jgi:hypothetical protein
VQSAAVFVGKIVPFIVDDDLHNNCAFRERGWLVKN